MMRGKRQSAGYRVIALLALLAACGDDTAPMVPEPQPPDAVGVIPTQVVVQGEQTTVDMATYFRDPDGGALTYAAASSAAGIVSVSQSASVLTLVGVAPGSVTVTVTASDPDRLTASQSFQTVVEAPNRPPVVVTAIPAQHMRIGEPQAVPLAPYFSDPDGDALSYTASSDRERVVVASVAGSRLILAAEGVGAATVTVAAVDPAGLAATQAVEVTVSPSNRAPQPRDTIPALSLSVADTVHLEVSSYFHDPDGDELSYSATSNAEGVATVTVSGDTATLVGVTAGTATLSVVATDPDSLVATQTAEVTVTDPNAAPQPVDSIPAQSLSVGDTATLALSRYFSDPDGDELSFTASTDDENVATATVAGSMLTLIGIGIGIGTGSTTLTVTAADPDGLTATQRASVTVEVGPGGFRDDFDSSSSLADWSIVDAEASVADGVLRVRPTVSGYPGYAQRVLALPLTTWEIRVRFGRTAEAILPSVVWWTGDPSIPVIRFEIDNPDAGGDYNVAFFSAGSQQWVAATDLTGDSEAVRLGRGELTDITISFDDGTLLVRAGETELVRHSEWSTAFGRLAEAALGSVTEIWLVAFGFGQGLFDYVDVSGLQGAASSAHRSSASLGSTSFLTSRWSDVKPLDKP